MLSGAVNPHTMTATGAAEVPEELAAAAAASQASLATKLAMLREVLQPFPAAIAPAGADHWIEDGAPPDPGAAALQAQRNGHTRMTPCCRAL